MDIRREEKSGPGWEERKYQGREIESSGKGTNRRDDLSAVRARARHPVRDIASACRGVPVGMCVYVRSNQNEHTAASLLAMAIHVRVYAYTCVYTHTEAARPIHGHRPWGYIETATKRDGTGRDAIRMSASEKDGVLPPSLPPSSARATQHMRAPRNNVTRADRTQARPIPQWQPESLTCFPGNPVATHTIGCVASPTRAPSHSTVERQTTDAEIRFIVRNIA